jgi:hypothetical protein
MPTYSEEDLTTAITAYCNGEYTLIRKYAYAFNILPTIPDCDRLDPICLLTESGIGLYPTYNSWLW